MGYRPNLLGDVGSQLELGVGTVASGYLNIVKR